MAPTTPEQIIQEQLSPVNIADSLQEQYLKHMREKVARLSGKDAALYKEVMKDHLISNGIEDWKNDSAKFREKMWQAFPHLDRGIISILVDAALADDYVRAHPEITEWYASVDTNFASAHERMKAGKDFLQKKFEKQFANSAQVETKICALLSDPVLQEKYKKDPQAAKTLTDLPPIIPTKSYHSPDKKTSVHIDEVEKLPVGPIKYLLDEYKCEADGSNCRAAKKTILPENIAKLLREYATSRTNNLFENKKRGLMNESNFNMYRGPLVDWKQYFDRGELLDFWSYLQKNNLTDQVPELKPLILAITN